MTKSVRRNLCKTRNLIIDNNGAQMGISGVSGSPFWRPNDGNAPTIAQGMNLDAPSSTVFSFVPNTLSMAIQNFDSPIPGHKYYGGCMFRTEPGFSASDGRFEWYYSEAENGHITFSTRTASTDGKWVLLSGTGILESLASETGWYFRNFMTNATTACYSCKHIVIDLTEVFGAGFEPSKEWCDAAVKEWYTFDGYSVGSAAVTTLNWNSYFSVSDSSGTVTRSGYGELDSIEDPREPVLTYELENIDSEAYLYLQVNRPPVVPGHYLYMSWNEYVKDRQEYFVWSESTRDVYAPVSEPGLANDIVCDKEGFGTRGGFRKHVKISALADNRGFSQSTVTSCRLDINKVGGAGLARVYNYYWADLYDGCDFMVVYNKWATANGLPELINVSQLTKEFCDFWIEGLSQPIIHIGDPDCVVGWNFDNEFSCSELQIVPNIDGVYLCEGGIIRCAQSLGQVLQNLPSYTTEYQWDGNGDTDMSLSLTFGSQPPLGTAITYTVVSDNGVSFRGSMTASSSDSLQYTVPALSDPGLATAESVTVTLIIRAVGYNTITNTQTIIPPLPTLQTPTLSLSRLGDTITGTIGNTVPGATYVYKRDSEPSSETDGEVINGTTFSLIETNAITVYVRGFKEGYTMSEAVSRYVAAQPTCAVPIISQKGNTIIITCSTPGATIYYKRGYSGSYSVYSGSFIITVTTIVYAYATAPGHIQSDEVSQECAFVVDLKLPTPVITQGEGAYTESIGNYAIITFVNGDEFAHLRSTLKMIIDKTYMDAYLELMGLGSSASSLETDESGNYIFNVSEMGDNFLSANSNFGEYIINDEVPTFRVKFRNVDYEDSEWGSCTYQMMKLKTPTLSLSRSGTTVSGTVGNRESLATYRYMVGSIPTSETDGSAVASNGTFSFINEDAITVFVRGFKAGYTMSSLVFDSVNAYRLPTPEPQFVDVNISEKWLSYYMDNLADYPSDTTFSIRVEDMDGGPILTTSTTKSALNTGPHEVHDSRIYDHPWYEDQGNGIVIVARASASGYADSSFGRTPVWDLDSVFPAPSDIWWGWFYAYGIVFDFFDIKEKPSHLNVEIVDCSFNESVININSSDINGYLSIRCDFYNKDVPSQEPPFTDQSDENIKNYIRGESLSIKVSTPKMPPRTIEFTFSDSNYGNSTE